MSVGLALLRHLIETRRGISVLSENGVGREFFTGDEELAVFDMVSAFQLEHGTPPKLRTVRTETGISFPSFPDEPVGHWLDGVKRRRQIKQLLNSAESVRAEAMEGEVEKAIETLKLAAFDIESYKAGDKVHQLMDIADIVLTAHDKRQITVTMSGIPFGFPFLDKVSDGAQASDTIGIIGRPGTGKTYFILKNAVYAHSVGKTPLIVPLEMSPKQTALRILALRTEIPATLLRLGRMSYWGREKIIADIGELKGMAGRPFYILEGSLSSSIEDIILRVKQLRPSALYVDGAYLLRVAGSAGAKMSRSDRVTTSAELLKTLAKDQEIPVFATYQFNRKGPGSLGNIYMSDAIGQLASIVLSIEDFSEEEEAGWNSVTYKRMTLLKGREGEVGELKVSYDMSRMKIEQVEVIHGANLLGDAYSEEQSEAVPLEDEFI